MRNMRELVEVYRLGEMMEDDELLMYNKEMSKATQLLVQLGPDYRLVANDTREQARMTDGYIRARELDKLPFVMSQAYSILELIEAGVFTHDDNEFNAADDYVAGGTVDRKYIVRTNCDAKIYGYHITKTGDYSVTYSNTDGNVDKNVQCFYAYL